MPPSGSVGAAATRVAGFTAALFTLAALSFSFSFAFSVSAVFEASGQSLMNIIGSRISIAARTCFSWSTDNLASAREDSVCHCW